MDARGEMVKSAIQGFFGLDIHRAHARYTERSYTFIWDDEPNMVRVSLGRFRSREEVLSELLWMDDLKQFVPNICEPVPSLNGRLIEEYSRANVHYRICQVKKPVGGLTRKVDPTYFFLAGDLLGRIHSASLDSKAVGFKYKRGAWYDSPDFEETAIRILFPADVVDDTLDTIARVRAMPEDPRWYGMIHADFNSNNYYVDMNNFWVYDFDSCCYGFFMYDIATACRTWLLQLISEKSRAELLRWDILPYFRMGYELHVQIPDQEWDELPLFIHLRQIEIVAGKLRAASLYYPNQSNTANELLCLPLRNASIYEGMDELVAKLLTVIGKDGVQMGEY